MSSELEAAGAAVTAGLVGAAIDSRKGGGSHAAAHGPCSNCGASLAGEYCSACGQPAHIHRTILHMAEEFLHGILHFDTRAWRTLPILVFRPGTLTHNYIHGKRARYISPIALFLLTVFTMFFVFALAGGALVKLDPADQTSSLESVRADLREAEQNLADAELVLAQRQDALAAASTGTLDAEAQDEAKQAFEAAQRRVESERVDLEAAKTALAALESVLVTGAPTGSAEGATPAPAETTFMDNIYEEIAEAARDGEITVNTGFKSVDKKILAKLLNPELAVYKVQNTAYKFSFLLVPISLPFMWLLFFWKRGVTLFDHCVFVLYSLSFMSLLFVLGALLALGPGVLLSTFSSIVSFAIPVHIYFQLKGAYGLGWFSALWRTFFLLLFCVLALSLFLVVIVVLGLGG